MNNSINLELVTENTVWTAEAEVETIDFFSEEAEAYEKAFWESI